MFDSALECSWVRLKRAGGDASDTRFAGCRYRQEGKMYVVQDGDVIFFKFNVTNKK